MKATISLDSLWQIVSSLSLRNQKWLAGKLQESIRQREETEYISKEELLAGIDAGLKDLKAGRMRPIEELFKELEHEVQD
ncbi:MAG TPA: surface protein [Candidatus Parabacteroides intestinigallinarum]|uniref:Surface protein n=1 Tax=Candidatus Parabacteroides intestinigallinarum TaxID=2838722 RepID=A0A9D1XPY9_9BACT|nr:surface protein [Candidatus Parabacteroides intestinigallinarum]